MKCTVQVRGSQLALLFEFNPRVQSLLRETCFQTYFDGASKRWIMPCIPANVKRLPEIFDDIAWTTEAQTLVKNHCKERFKWYEILNDHCPEKIEGIKHPKGFQPRDHQKIASVFAVANKRVLIGDDIGVGKSCEAITATLLAKAETTLIVCPKYLIPTWVSELRLWIGANPMVVDVKSLKKINALTPHAFEDEIKKAKYCITNYESVRKFKGATNRPWSALIIDEFHFIKSSQAARSRAVTEINSEYVFALSGTPMPNRVIELWNILNFLTFGQFGSKHSFGFRYCNGHKAERFIGVRCGNPACGVRIRTKQPCWKCGSPNFQEQFLKFWDDSGTSNAQELNIRLDDIMIRRTSEEMRSEIPPRNKYNRVIEMSQDFRTKYNQLTSDLKSYLVNVKGKTDDEASRSMKAEALAKVGYMRQLLSEAKVEAIADEAIQVIGGGKNLVILTQYMKPLELLRDAISKRITESEIPGKVLLHHGTMDGDLRGPTISEFQKSKSTVLIGTIGSTYQGLTLTSAAYEFLVEMPQSSEILKQCHGRIDREGQKEVTYFFHFFVKDTAEMDCIEKLAEKKRAIDGVIEGVESTGYEDLEFEDLDGLMLKNILSSVKPKRKSKKKKEIADGDGPEDQSEATGSAE